ncbi:CD209 antigen-like isoform X1 [Channa argus]|uniref:CD209 antigen-like isoform X1 n=2 Tax=Channa argus TaxID=215402 RepID=UPI00352137A9
MIILSYCHIIDCVHWSCLCSGPRSSERGFYRAAVLCLGLLSVFLLVGLIILGVHYHNSECGAAPELSTVKANMTELLQDSEKEVSSLTEEKNQLKTSLSSLTRQKDQLDASLSSLTAERNQLKTSLSSLTAERDQLKTSLSSLTREKDQLDASLSSLTAERNQLKTSLSSLTAERDQLKTSLSSLTREKDQLDASLSSLTAERNQLKTSLSSLTAERNQLKTSLSSLTREKNQLDARLIEMTKDRDKLESLSKRTCPAGWIKFSWSCYLLSNRSDSWTNGKSDCQNKGADLMVINSEDEQKFVINSTIASGFSNLDTWIGLSDTEEEKTWKWIDGTPLSYTQWNVSQPDNGGNQNIEEDCAHIKAYNGKWNDLPCGNSLQWICEKKA